LNSEKTATEPTTSLAVPIPAIVTPTHASRAMLLRRLELKYVLDRTTRTALARNLAALMHPDPHADSDGVYLVRSLYFDTPDYMAYHEKLSGASMRHKLRVRVYGKDPSQTRYVRLEIKSRYVNAVHKIAVDVPREEYNDIERALKQRVLPPTRLLNNSDLQEILRLQRQYNMEPKVIVQYRRQALERKEISRVRVSFDDELLATRHLELLGPLRGARRLLQLGHAVFEIKVDGTLPYWLHALISKYNLQSEAVSKYCYAVRSEGRFSAIGREEEYFLRDSE
jgi:hypothetical protein